MMMMDVDDDDDDDDDNKIMCKEINKLKLKTKMSTSYKA